MKYLYGLCVLLFLSSCGNETESAAADSVPVLVSTKPTVTGIQPLRPNIELMPWQGNLADAIYWKDARGENAVVISYNPQYFWAETNPDAKTFFPKDGDEETLSELTEIFATHYVLKAGEAKWNVYSSYHDFLFGCCDVYMNYQPSSLQVADADSNGTGEALFMYHETEGDGMLSHSFLGTLVLELDSAYYTLEGETGLGAEIAGKEAGDANDIVKTKKPESSVYNAWMLTKWDELFRIKVEQDRAEVTEQNNVDEHGHADHQH